MRVGPLPGDPEGSGECRGISWGSSETITFSNRSVEIGNFAQKMISMILWVSPRIGRAPRWRGGASAAGSGGWPGPRTNVIHIDC